MSNHFVPEGAWSPCDFPERPFVHGETYFAAKCPACVTAAKAVVLGGGAYLLPTRWGFESLGVWVERQEREMRR